jgi:hypothetical protein
VVMDGENVLLRDAIRVGPEAVMAPYKEIDVLVVVPPSAAPSGLKARSRRIVHLADADSGVPSAMLSDLRASVLGLVAIFGERSPAVAVASSIYSVGLPLVLFPDEPAKAPTS